MKKKLSHVIFASFLALALLVPMFPSTAKANVSQRNMDLFLEQMALFGRVIDNSVTVLGVQRVVVLTSVATGIPESSLTLNAQLFGLSLRDFIAASIIAHSAGVPVSFVVDRLNLNRDFGQIALELNFPIKLALLRINSLITAFNGEIAIQTGMVQPNLNQNLIDLTTAFNVMNKRFDFLVLSLGQQTAVSAVFTILTKETGLSPEILAAMRQTLPPANASLGQFSSFVLGRTSLSAANGPVLNDAVVYLSPARFIRALDDNNIPSSFFTARAVFFSKMATTSANQIRTNG